MGKFTETIDESEGAVAELGEKYFSFPQKPYNESVVRNHHGR